MTKTTSFQGHIRPLFPERDSRGMSKAFKWEVTMTSTERAAAIYQQAADEDRMPQMIMEAGSAIRGGKNK